MKRFFLFHFLFAGLAIVLLTGCKNADSLPEENAAYFWRTEWQLNKTEKDFLSQHHIGKVYCRYFDVVMLSADDVEPMPNATIHFASPVPQDLEIVPTVYITEDCMHKDYPGLAARIVERIVQISETNDVGNVHEVQMDCDFTANSRERYYAFLEEARTAADKHKLKLSTTIRLHQLSMPAPPVDYGVLMLYNTGDPMKFEQRNPVLDLRDVQPYIERLSDYTLPLATAYPVFCWQRFVEGVNIEHTVNAEEILRVKAAVEQQRPSLSRDIIIYHLDNENIKRYDAQTYENIFRH